MRKYSVTVIRKVLTIRFLDCVWIGHHSLILLDEPVMQFLS